MGFVRCFFVAHPITQEAGPFFSLPSIGCLPAIIMRGRHTQPKKRSQKSIRELKRFHVLQSRFQAASCMLPKRKETLRFALPRHGARRGIARTGLAYAFGCCDCRPDSCGKRKEAEAGQWPSFHGLQLLSGNALEAGRGQFRLGVSTTAAKKKKSNARLQTRLVQTHKDGDAVVARPAGFLCVLDANACVLRLCATCTFCKDSGSVPGLYIKISLGSGLVPFAGMAL